MKKDLFDYYKLSDDSFSRKCLEKGYYDSIKEKEILEDIRQAFNLNYDVLQLEYNKELDITEIYLYLTDEEVINNRNIDLNSKTLGFEQEYMYKIKENSELGIYSYDLIEKYNINKKLIIDYKSFYKLQYFPRNITFVTSIIVGFNEMKQQLDVYFFVMKDTKISRLDIVQVKKDEYLNFKNNYKILKEKDKMQKYTKDDIINSSIEVCSVCNSIMIQGYICENEPKETGNYCSEKCLYEVYTEEEYQYWNDRCKAYWNEWYTDAELYIKINDYLKAGNKIGNLKANNNEIKSY